MPNISHQVYRRLYDAFGPQHWWPGESPFEVMVGAVLVQNTAWKNVERAIGNLREANLLTAEDFLAASSQELEELIRPAGYFRLKVKRLRHLVDFFNREYDASITKMRSAHTKKLREQLLALNGIGPETADSILLYALDKPVMVVDTYTQRVFERHGWVNSGIGYYRLQQYLLEQLPAKVAIYNEMHALLVNVGHHHCRKTPHCEACPLLELLPESGIVAPEA